jgi:alpha-beta hydrolase superfamily lysophospholipase
MSATTALPVSQWRAAIDIEPGVQLAAAGWIPVSPRAIALICHGHAEHLGRYGHVVAALAADGFAVYGVDHRGHGRSTGRRALIVDFDRIADDFRELAKLAGARHPGLPVVLIGHSMGGLIALRYTLRYQDSLTALVTSGPALILDEGVSPLTVTAGKALATIAPSAPIPRQGPGAAGCSLSTERYICEQFGIDHRTYHGPTRAGTAAAMLASGADTLARAGEIRLPLLAMHGADDTTTFPRGTELLVAGASSADKTKIIWGDTKHEIFNSPGRREVIGAMRRWLNERLPAAEQP